MKKIFAQLAQVNLSLFAPTADQRYLLGPEIFLRTHFPMHMIQYGHNTPKKVVAEQTLLDKLLDPPEHIRGNRVWVVYGTPGTGKSELMKWLETRIRQENQQRSMTMVRISRTELDILSIMERFNSMLSNQFLRETIHQRWQLARQKPRTLSKLILLYALENLCDSDEVINALFYRLLNIVHPYVETLLQYVEGDHSDQSVEIISLEAWNAIINQISIPVYIDYEHFRHQLTIAFCQHLLEGFSLPETLRQISLEVCKRYNTRPLLLIDDLVQSLNLFATDLIDYFITLEEGNWDVIIGLTPAAFEGSQRGRLLLERISYLDTIDDRVEKLWLSDEAGHTSSVLTEENCYEFAAIYLSEYRTQAGSEEVLSRVLFNREVLTRIYRGLPRGKGKVRYFLRHLRLILEDVARGESPLETIARFTYNEYVVHNEDPFLSLLCNLYGPLLLHESQRGVTLSSELLQAFGIQRDEIFIPVEPLFSTQISVEASTTIQDDEEKRAIHDWLVGHESNRQLLRSLRQGTARFLRTAGISTGMYFPNIAQPSAILNWQQPYMEVHPPICLEGLDDANGIPLLKSISQIAFDLHRYAHATGTEAKAIEATLFNSPQLRAILYAASEFHEQKMKGLEKQLGMSLEHFAIGLFFWSLIIQRENDSHEVVPLPEAMQQKVRSATIQFSHSGYEYLRPSIKEWRQCFDDFFKLREHLYDVPRLTAYYAQHTLQEVFECIVEIDTNNIGHEYHWGRKPLWRVLAEWQEVMKKLLRNTQTGLPNLIQEMVSLLENAGSQGVPLSDIPLEVLTTLDQENPELASHMRIYLKS